MEEEWIRSKGLLKLIGKHRPDWQQPELQLRPFLTRGLISARCKSAELKFRGPGGTKSSTFEKDWSIPPSAWKGTNHIPGTFLLADDVLATPVSGFDFWAVSCLGLSFLLADVLEACDIAPDDLAPERTNSTDAVDDSALRAPPLPRWFGTDAMADMEYFHEMASDIRSKKGKSYRQLAKMIVEREHPQMDHDWKETRLKRLYDNVRLIYHADGFPKAEDERSPSNT